MNDERNRASVRGGLCIALGAAGLFGALLPLSEIGVGDYTFFLSAQHVATPISEMLFIIPAASLILGILMVTGKLSRPDVWMMVLSLLGFATVAIAAVGAKAAFQMLVNLGGKDNPPDVGTALGAWWLLGVYTALFVVSCIRDRRAAVSPRQEPTIGARATSLPPISDS